MRWSPHLLALLLSTIALLGGGCDASPTWSPDGDVVPDVAPVAPDAPIEAAVNGPGAPLGDGAPYASGVDRTA